MRINDEACRQVQAMIKINVNLRLGRAICGAVFAIILSSLVAVPSHAQDVQTAILPEHIVEQYDLDPDGDLLMVPVTINREVYPFILDSGTTLNAYDTLLKKHLGPLQQVVDVKTASGTESLKLYDPPRAYLGRFNLRSPEGVTCMDLAGVRRATGHDFYGIIGMAFMLDRVVHLNFDQGKLSFLRHDAPRLGTPIRLSIVREMPRVEVEFQGLGWRSLLVDTGSVGIGSGNLSARDFDTLLKQGNLSLLGSCLSADLSQQNSSARFGSIKRLQVGREVHDGLIFSDHVNSDILGMGFWKRYNVTFDFRNRVVYLQKNQYDPALDDANRDLSGLQLRGKKGQIVVHGVSNGSSAFLAGIQPGDRITKVDGKETAELGIRTIRRQLTSPGQEVKLVFQRGSQDFDVVLRLAERRTFGLQPQSTPGN